MVNSNNEQGTDAIEYAGQDTSKDYTYEDIKDDSNEEPPDMIGKNFTILTNTYNFTGVDISFEKIISI